MKQPQKFVAAAALLALILTGCAAPSYDVEVCLSPKFKETMKVYPSLEVDVVGVNPNEEERFASCRIDDYFAVNNALRGGTDHFTLTFSEDSVTPKLLSRSHPVWIKFGRKEANKLYLLVNLPVNDTKNDVGKDSRKVVIPLERPCWFGSTSRYFEITPAGILPLSTRPDGYPEPRIIDGTGEDGK